MFVYIFYTHVIFQRFCQNKVTKTNKAPKNTIHNGFPSIQSTSQAFIHTAIQPHICPYMHPWLFACALLAGWLARLHTCTANKNWCKTCVSCENYGWHGAVGIEPSILLAFLVAISVFSFVCFCHLCVFIAFFCFSVRHYFKEIWGVFVELLAAWVLTWLGSLTQAWFWLYFSLCLCT